MQSQNRTGTLGDVTSYEDLCSQYQLDSSEIPQPYSGQVRPASLSSAVVTAPRVRVIYGFGGSCGLSGALRSLSSLWDGAFRLPAPLPLGDLQEGPGCQSLRCVLPACVWTALGLGPILYSVLFTQQTGTRRLTRMSPLDPPLHGISSRMLRF